MPSKNMDFMMSKKLRLVQGIVDAVLTFEELQALYYIKDIDISVKQALLHPISVLNYRYELLTILKGED